MKQFIKSKNKKKVQL